MTNEELSQNQLTTEFDPDAQERDQYQKDQRAAAAKFRRQAAEARAAGGEDYAAQCEAAARDIEAGEPHTNYVWSMSGDEDEEDRDTITMF